LTAAVEPGYPDETIGRALAMWIAWLLSGYGGFYLHIPADLRYV